MPMIARLAQRKCAHCNARLLSSYNLGPGYTPGDLILKTPVGRGATITGPDVKTVQAALNAVDPQWGGPLEKLEPDGIAGPKTLGAIERFQQAQFGFKDGRIDLLGKTHARLSGMQPEKIAIVTKLKEGLERARESVAASIRTLDRARFEMIVPGNLGRGEKAQLANQHFQFDRSPEPIAALERVRKVYMDMQLVFSRRDGPWGWTMFEADPFTTMIDAVAFTTAGGFGLGGQYVGYLRSDRIYLCNRLLRADRSYQILTLVHELAHFVGPSTGNIIDDKAYGDEDDRDMKALSPAARQTNAENYNNFALAALLSR
jgi:peptidoglycan hydrolase-like protein with peptidoglycan-binding domain